MRTSAGDASSSADATGGSPSDAGDAGRGGAAPPPDLGRADARDPSADARGDAGPATDTSVGDARALADAGGPSDAGGPADAAPLDARSAGDAGGATDAAPVADILPPGPDVDPNRWRLPEREVCAQAYAAPVEAAILEDPALIEASGIVASPTTPGLLWLHNDSGDAARLFAAGTDGTRLGRIFLRDVTARDFEDLGVAPCPDGRGPCLWIADIGNNRHNRNDLAVYLLDEPVVEPGTPFADRFSGPVQRFPFHYPMQAAPDAEALLVAPDGSTFYVLEKIDWDRARVWMHPGPLVPDVDVELVALHDFPNPGLDRPGGRMITGASMHPSGRRILVRVYSGVYEYRFDAAGGVDRLDQAEVVEVVLGPREEAQGEAVTYDATGTGLYTISEGAARALHAYACLPAP